MELKDVKRIAVIGLGKMGADWVVQLLEGGYEVVGYDNLEDTRSSVTDAVGKGLSWVEKKRVDREKNRVHPEGFAEEALARFTVVDSLSGLFEGDGVQIVLECVFEDLKLKQDLFEEIEGNLTPSMVLWTNTSSLDVEAMGRAAAVEDRLVGTHGMNPVYIMPAVECVKSDAVEEDAFELTIAVLEKLGKTPFVAKNVSGFWVNKRLVPFMLDAYRGLELGETTVKDGDTGLKYSLGHPQGVFKLSDLIGQDTMYRVAMAMYLATQDPRLYPPFILAKMFRDGQLGQKTGQGFYKWEGMKNVEPVDFTDFQIKDTDTVLL